MGARGDAGARRTLAVLQAGARALIRFVPRAGRDVATAADALGTFHALCAAAHRRRGWLGLVREGLLEWLDLAKQAVRGRLGRQTSVRRDRPNRSPREATFAMQKLWHDLRLAWRGVVTSRASAGVAIGTLALGIGLGTAVFSILDSMLWRPVPYRDADRLVELMTFNTQRKFALIGFYSPALIRAWRAQGDLFNRIEAYDTPSLVYTTEAGSEMVAGAVVTPGLFSLLGVPPEAGRVFGLGDGQATTSLAVVSDAFWRAQLNRDPNAVGREIVLDGERHRIVGIMPPAFRFPNGQIQVWTPYDVEHPPSGATATRTLTPLARLAPGISREMATTQAWARGARLSASVGEGSDVTAEVVTIINFVDDKTRRSLWILAGGVGFLFLVVCANVANLALSRSILRARDLAVRAALGASRRDLMRQTLVESGLMAAIGGLAGVVLAALLIRVALAVLPDSMTASTLNPFALEARATAVALGLGSLAAVLFGLPAAVVASGSSVTQLLGARSRGTSGSATSRRFRSALVVAEVSVSIVLLVGAALMTRSFLKLEDEGKGFDSTSLISVRLALPALGYGDPAQREQFMRDAIGRIRQAPGVTGVTAAGLPTEARPIMLGHVEFAQRPGELTPPLIVPMHDVPRDYFTVLGLPIVDGRTFRGDDTADAVVVSESFARKYWPDGHALSGQFRSQNGDWQTVIGIAGDVRPMAADQHFSELHLYYQTGQAPQAMRPSMSVSSIAEYRMLVVRAVRPADTIAALPSLIHTIDPRVVIWRTALVDHLYADAIARPRIVLALMAIFAGAGLVLAMAGIYGVLSYLVTQRVREIGIRLALGATRSHIGRLVLGSGLGLTAVGLVAGLALALALSRVMQTLLYEVGPSDPVSMAAVSVLLVLTAALASWWPARRAMRVDPVRLLREE